MATDFQEELRALINKHSLEQDSNTPDFVLASYLVDCLRVWNVAVGDRYKYYQNHEVPHVRP